MRPWQRELYRCLRRAPISNSSGRKRGIPPILVTLAAAVLVSGTIIGLLETRLRPIVAAAAQAQVQNSVTALMEQAVTQDLARRELGYADLVQIQRDEGGAITALTTNMAELNLLRAELISKVLEALAGLNASEISIPLGSLFDSDLIWALGPSLHARSMSVGTVCAEFDSEFSSAGVNQTRHRVCLKLSVPITVLLPGSRTEVPVETSLCVAETVIVGQVPDTYLQVGQP